MLDNKKIGLALSGGGNRAVAFHLGTFRALKKLGLLGKIDIISTVSGGSIIGAYYVLNQDNFDSFEKTILSNLRKSSIPFFRVILGIFLILLTPIIAFFLLNYLFGHFFVVSLVVGTATLIVLVTFQFKIFPISYWITKSYDNLYFAKKTLKDFPEIPKIGINATNIATGRPWTFSKNKMNDSSYEIKNIHFKSDNYPIAKAVMSSSCVPFAFTPITIEKKYFIDSKYTKNINPVLIDGGVFDNQGIHKLAHEKSSYECDIIITSDAGNKLPNISKFGNTLSLLIRTGDIFMNRIKNQQLIQHIYRGIGQTQKEIAFISLGYDTEPCLRGFINAFRDNKLAESTIAIYELDKSMTDQHILDIVKQKINYDSIVQRELSNEKLTVARNVSTNLISLLKTEIECLSSHAEVLTELQIKLYCPSLIYK